MMSPLTVAVLVFAGLCAAEGKRIVGGQPAGIADYPSIVQVEGRSGILWSQSCGGSIITERHVLSAAHCFMGLLTSTSNRRIRAGSHQRSTGGVTVGLNRIINHPTFNRNTLDGDISLLVLAQQLTFDTNIQAVPIISQGFELPDDLPVVQAGWGTTSSGGLTSSVLRDVIVYTINRPECRRRYAEQLLRPRQVTDNMLCVGILDVGGKDACQGDSGGPLYYNSAREDILVGVVSWGYGCGHPIFPGVNAAVSSYTNWIVANAQ